MDERYEAVLALLEAHRELLVEVAEELLRVEVIDRERFDEMVA
ncbi:MAG: hypothetical protein ACOC7V_07610 [Spirochaetota bacterium]